MSFDDIIDRRGTHCVKWDMMEQLYGVANDTGLAMWVADMDFRPPQVILDAVQSQVDHGIFGYFGDDSAYRAAIQWWMQNRHGWEIDTSHIFTDPRAGQRDSHVCRYVHAARRRGYSFHTGLSCLCQGHQSEQ